MNIIVTGASKGVGYELVKSFSLTAGAKIIGIARNKQRLRDLEKECLELNSDSSVKVIPFDLGRFEGIREELVPKIEAEFSHIDILINNAGFLINKPFYDITPGDLDQAMKVNVQVPFHLIQGLLALLKKAESSHVVNISSMGGIQGSVKFAGLAAYSASKGALGILTECLAEELRDTSVVFNCLALGAVQTEMLEEAFPGYRAPVNAGEMAEFIREFALNAHRFMNGKIIPVSLSTP